MSIVLYTSTPCSNFQSARSRREREREGARARQGGRERALNPKPSSEGERQRWKERQRAMERLRQRGLSDNQGLGFRVSIFWGPCTKDPTIKGTIVGSPIFGHPHITYVPQNPAEGQHGFVYVSISRIRSLRLKA